MVSVIIPTYNRVGSICKSVMSVLNQTYQNIEVIVVDDGSNDGTREKLTTIKDNRLRYVYQENQGACVARNLGIDLAQGDIIAFQDSDDIWRKNKLEEQLLLLNLQGDAGYDIVFCAFLRTDEQGTQLQIPGKKFENSMLSLHRLLMGNVISTQTIVGKRECFLNEKFDINMPRFQDWDLMIRMIQKYKIGYCNQVLVDVFVKQDSISMNFPKGYDAICKIYEKNRQFIKRDQRLINQYEYYTSFYQRGVELESLNRYELVKKLYELEKENKRLKEDKK